MENVKPIDFRDRILAFVILAATAGVYWRTAGLGFVIIDDLQFLRSPVISKGLSVKGVLWAFSGFHSSYYIPVNWISHMADFSVFGANPAGHHIVNSVFHGVNALLFFVFLRLCTGRAWESAFAAAFFALHPVNVESAAWVTERKDVLSLFFGLLCLHAYREYIIERKAGLYAASIALFALGLLTKPVLVTLPILMLLLDYWPLNRFDKASDIFRLALEKAPFLVLSAASGLLTILAHSRQGGLNSLDSIPLAARLANASTSILHYLQSFACPKNLAVFYPHPMGGYDIFHVLPGAGIVLSLSFAAIKFRRSAGCFFTGWFWFLISLAPVMGLIQPGWQAMADRFTYIPYMGLIAAAVWCCSDMLSRVPWSKFAGAIAAVFILIFFSASASAQIKVWTNSYTLVSHALNVTENNYFADLAMHQIMKARGAEKAARYHYDRAARSNPVFLAVWHNKRGGMLAQKGSPHKALPHFEKAVSLNPDYALAWYNFGMALIFMNKCSLAEEKLARAIELRPGWSAPQKAMDRLPENCFGFKKEK